MAQNITLLGASYTGVPAVELPKTGGGTASFTDVTDTTAAAADVASGKYFYTASGVKTEGTNGGSGTWETTSFTANGQRTMSFSTSGTAKAFAIFLTSGNMSTSLLSSGITVGAMYTGSGSGVADVLTYSSNRIAPSTSNFTPTITSSSVSISLSYSTLYNGVYSVYYLV